MPNDMHVLSFVVEGTKYDVDGPACCRELRVLNASRRMVDTLFTPLDFFSRRFWWRQEEEGPLLH